MQKILITTVLIIASAFTYADYYPALEHKVYGTPAAETDKVSIDDAMTRLWLAWAEEDAAAVANVHTIDAEWTNAFGRTYRGSDELEEFLKNGLFPAFDKEVSEREAASFVEISRRYIGDEAAVITGRVESDRGSSVGTSNRKIGFTFVLTKFHNEWKISNQVITDLREKRK